MSFLALLLGAGVSGGFLSPALAGDKIEFSHASDSLALPAVDRPETQPDKDLSSFFKKPAPRVTMPYVVPTAEAPSRRFIDHSLRNGNGGLDSDRPGLERNTSLDNSPSDAYASPNYSYKPASNSVDSLRAWGTFESPDPLGRGLERMDARRSQAGARLDPSSQAEGRDRRNELGLGSYASRLGALRADDAYGSDARNSLSDLLRPQDKSSPEANPGQFKSTSAFSESRALSAWATSASGSVRPSDSPSLSPLDAAAAGYNAYQGTSGRAPSLGYGKNPGRQEQGFSSGLPAFRAPGDMPGFGFQPPKTAPPRKPLPTPSQGPSGQQKPGAPVLEFPKMPGSLF
jgi:hypothetical protein